MWLRDFWFLLVPITIGDLRYLSSAILVIETWFGLQFRTHKVIYRRYAGLFFSLCVDITDNELVYLESIHLFVEILDHFFSNVCELDLVFNFQKVCYHLLSSSSLPCLLISWFLSHTGANFKHWFWHPASYDSFCCSQTHHIYDVYVWNCYLQNITSYLYSCRSTLFWTSSYLLESCKKPAKRCNCSPLLILLWFANGQET